HRAQLLLRQPKPDLGAAIRRDPVNPPKLCERRRHALFKRAERLIVEETEAVAVTGAEKERNVAPQDWLGIEDRGERAALEVQKDAVGIGPEFIRKPHLREEEDEREHLGGSCKTENKALAIWRPAADLDAAARDDNDVAARARARTDVGAARVEL